jgi:hypothetical protein
MAMAKEGSDLLGEAEHDRLTLIDIGANTGYGKLERIGIKEWYS